MVPQHADAVFPRPGRGGLSPGLEALGVTDIFFELFDATHDAIEYRYPIAIKYLAERLTPNRTSGVVAPPSG